MCAAHSRVQGERYEISALVINTSKERECSASHRHPPGARLRTCRNAGPSAT
ncbi:hypothetical protein EXIGLDRAFT_726457 [Exidia glandulosa HHB12029]|uniref:Uncharacterized protein n=1 Tax=Exidia glandulosa HHB12029 TaxID=1314781 RepID=A0A165M9U7_EXIGL|nr:hypothetical protein EXIGLDRAFT_726457 [Exidia glandulosa HHB12029]